MNEKCFVKEFAEHFFVMWKEDKIPLEYYTDIAV